MLVAQGEGSSYDKAENMKRIGNIFQDIIDLHNLKVADMLARRGKTSNKEIEAFDKDRDSLLLQLHQSLADGTFRTSPYTCFTVYEPKERLIFKLPYYPDRITQHAIMNILEPIWTRTLTHNTYSCITGRGIEGCAKRVDTLISRFDGRPLYCLKIDIRKFYPSIDHDVLKSILRKKIKDTKALALIDGIVDSAQGLPIGNYLSQCLSNLYLAYFMHEINETLKVPAVEYADDIVFFADNKETLHNTLDFAQHYIETNLRLKIKDNYQIFPVADNRQDKHGRALDFVGYKFYRHQRLLRKRIKQRLCRKVARLNANPGISVKEYKRSVSPWLGWCQHSNSRHLLQKIIRTDYQNYIIKPKHTSK